jgi:hypothetical protein
MEAGTNSLRHERWENIKSIIGYFAKSLLNSSCDQSSFSTLKDICEKVWFSNAEKVRNPGTILPQDIISNIIQVAFRLKDQAFFEDAALEHGGNLSLDFFKWARDRFAAGDVAFDSIQRGYGVHPPDSVYCY